MTINATPMVSELNPPLHREGFLVFIVGGSTEPPTDVIIATSLSENHRDESAESVIAHPVRPMDCH
jgi:hypothetical protein